MSQTLVPASMLDPNAQFMGFKNRIINGAMNVWQRGATFTASGGGYYTADRWQTLSQSGTYSQSNDVPAGFKYSLSVVSNSANYGTLCQRIESANCYDLVGQSVTISFWAKATSGGTGGLVVNLDYATAADNFASTTNFASATTAALTSTWTKYTLTFNSLPANVANGLQLYLFNAQGGSAAVTYLVTGVQLEKGSTATSFDYRPYGTELALCQRYFCQFGGQALFEPFGLGVGVNNTTASFQLPLPVPMRTAPTAVTVLNVGNISGTFGTPSSIAFDTAGVSIAMITSSYTAGSGGLNVNIPGRMYAGSSTAPRIQFSTEL